MCSYNYIGDCASAIITVLINGKCGEAYNTANPDVRLTIAQLAEIIASAANRKVVFADPDDVDLAYLIKKSWIFLITNSPQCVNRKWVFYFFCFINNLLKFRHVDAVIYISSTFPNIFQHNTPNQKFLIPAHIDPSCLKTEATVLIKILISNPKFQFAIYFISSFTTSSKSVISLLPLTCHIPVIPGFIASRAR